MFTLTVRPEETSHQYIFEEMVQKLGYHYGALAFNVEGYYLNPEIQRLWDGYKKTVEA